MWFPNNFPRDASRSADRTISQNRVLRFILRFLNFKSQPGDCLSWLIVSVVFLGHSNQVPALRVKLYDDRFLPCPYQFIKSILGRSYWQRRFINALWEEAVFWDVSEVLSVSVSGRCIWNVGVFLPDFAGQRPRRQSASFSQPRELETPNK